MIYFLIMNPLFDLNIYHISQKLLADRGIYYLFNENGQQILYVEQTAFYQSKYEFFVYTDQSKTTKLLSIQQDKVFQLLPSFTITDAAGTVIGYIKRKFAILRSTWLIMDSSGNEIAQAIADFGSMVLGDLMDRSNIPLPVSRRDLLNFNIMSANKRIGEFNRNLSIGDKYLLNLSQDESRIFDRRLAVSLGIILDAGERR